MGARCLTAKERWQLVKSFCTGVRFEWVNGSGQPISSVAVCTREMGRQTSAKSTGAQRLYFCHPCGAKHNPPTGMKCTRRKIVSSDGGEDPSPESTPIREKRATRAGRKVPKAVDSQGSDSETEKSTAKAGRAKSHTVSEDKQETENMFEMIMGQMQSMAMEQKKAREADRAEMRAALKDMNSKLEKSVISEDEGEKEASVGEEETEMAFAAPVKRKGAGKTTTTDPVSRLRADKASSAQAQLLLSTKGARLLQDEEVEVRSGYYRTLADNQKFEVPWPCDTVYRSNGKRANYDSMHLQEFTQGYLHIIASSLPINKSTRAAFDHIAYLCDILTDSMHTDWDLVLNSHRQVLHMIEQGQLTWENVEARNMQREKQLARADKERQSGRGRSASEGTRAQPSRPSYQGRVLTCTPYQTGKCTHVASHHSNGQWLQHLCATCVRVTGQKNGHREVDCKRKALYDARVRTGSHTSA